MISRCRIAPAHLGGRSIRARTLFAAAPLALTILAGSALAAEIGGVPQNPKIVPLARSSENATLTRIRLTVNKSETVRIEVPVGDVLVGASEIADVIPVSDRTLYMLGKKVGTTNVSLFDAAKRLVGVIDVVVGEDVAAIREETRRRDIGLEADIRRATGVQGLQVRSQGDRSALVGVAPDAVTVDRAMQVAPPGTANLTRIASPQQVTLKVRFVEVTRSAGRELGVRWGLASHRGEGRVGLFNSQSTPVTQSPGAGRFAPGESALNAATFAVNPFATGILHLTRNIDVTISALEDQGILRRLAEPNLTAISGSRAEFLAGGQIPIPTPQASGAGTASAITVTYKDFGVRLQFTPTVLAGGTIHLALEPEVSDIDPTLSVGIGGGVSIPGLTTRRAKTEVQLRDGQSFAIAGLLSDQSQRNLEQLPWLGSIPILGALFSSKQYQSRETELVVIVTPSIVKPVKPGQLLASPLDTTMPPNDLDFFASGKNELRRNMREFVTKEGRAVGPHGHLIPRVVGDQMDPNCAGITC